MSRPQPRKGKYMLVVQEHLIKLGGVKLSGQMKSIDISETATIENIEDDKGKTKANQPTGYEAAKITIEFILEDSPGKTQEEQIKAMQRLFKPPGQKKAKLLKVSNKDCAYRGISKVYFQKLSTKNTIAQSKRTATLELLAPAIAGIRVKKKEILSTKGTISRDKKRDVIDGDNKFTSKKKNKSPAKKDRAVSGAKTKARMITGRR